MLNVFTLVNGRLFQEEIESLEPPADLEEAVEGLVSAVLMLADVSRPLRPGAGQPGRGPGNARLNDRKTGAGRAGPGPSRPKQTGRR